MKRSRKELATMCSESLIDCWTLAYSSSSRRVLWHEPDMILFSTGAKSNWQNGVMRARFTPRNMATRTRKALEYFRARRLPMVWFVDLATTPKGLARHLPDVGLAPEWETPCMAVDAAKVRREKLPPGLTIRPVNNLRSLEVCVATADAGFSDGKKDSGAWREIYSGLGFSPTNRWFTGFLHGRPVASSLLMLHRGMATVWIVATLKEARGLGIGTAMTREAVLEAKKLGYDHAIIQASKNGLPVYEKIGFVEYSKIIPFIWNPD